MKKENDYAITNILKSIENASVYTSYLDNWELRSDLEEMISDFKNRIEQKINEYREV